MKLTFRSRVRASRIQVKGPRNETTGYYPEARNQRFFFSSTRESLRRYFRRSKGINKQRGTSTLSSLLSHFPSVGSTILLCQIAVRAEMLQILLTAIVESDVDASGTFTDQEIKVLQMRLSNLPGISTNSERLLQRLTAGSRALSSVLTLVADIDRDDVPLDQRVFYIDNDEATRNIQ